MGLVIHMLPVLSPFGVFMLKIWVGRTRMPPQSMAEVKLSLPWALLSVVIWMLTIQWSQGRLILCCGKVAGKDRPRYFRWEKLFAFVGFVFVVLTCGTTSNPTSADVVFAVCAGLLGTVAVYLLVGYLVIKVAGIE